MKTPCSGSSQSTLPLNLAGKKASSHRTGSEERVILVGILSSSSGIPSLSWSQSDDPFHPSSRWSQSTSVLLSASSSLSMASGPVLGSVGLAIAEPLPKSSWSHGLVDSEPKRVGHSITSSSSFIPSASSSSSISSLRPSLSWSQGVMKGVAPDCSITFTIPSPSQSLSAQFGMPSLS